MFHALKISAFVALAFAAVVPAAAQGRVEAGVLECSSGPNTSFVVGSVTELICMFRPTVGPAQNYRATIRRVGLDIGFTQDSSVAWLVLAPTRQVGPGELAGNYGGLSASAAVGVGGGANLMVGGSNSSFALQPLSLQGQTGVNVAAGISSLELR